MYGLIYVVAICSLASLGVYLFFKWDRRRWNARWNAYLDAENEWDACNAHLDELFEAGASNEEIDAAEAEAEKAWKRWSDLTP